MEVKTPASSGKGNKKHAHSELSATAPAPVPPSAPRPGSQRPKNLPERFRSIYDVQSDSESEHAPAASEIEQDPEAGEPLSTPATPTDHKDDEVELLPGPHKKPKTGKSPVWDYFKKSASATGTGPGSGPTHNETGSSAATASRVARCMICMANFSIGGKEVRNHAFSTSQCLPLSSYLRVGCNLGVVETP